MEKRYVKATELPAYTGLGRDRSKRLAVEAGAAIHYGRRVMYDIKKIDAYMETLTGR